MGSWDKAPEGFYEFGDGIWNPPHAIVCNSKWDGITRWVNALEGECHNHRTVEEVRACYAAARDAAKGIDVWPCSWLLEGRYDDGSKFTYECGAPTRQTAADGSYECIAGHDFVPAQTRWEQGWDYADGPEEAAGLARAGTYPVAMDGGSIAW